MAACHLSYVVGISAETSVWPPGRQPLVPPRYGGRGRPPTNLRRGARQHPVAVRALAVALAPTAWRTIRWREGTKGTMTSRFAAVRVRAAHRDTQRTTPRAEEWLLVEWPRGAPEPIKYWLSTVPADIEIGELVRLAKIRWRIERDYQELAANAPSNLPQAIFCRRGNSTDLDVLTRSETENKAADAGFSE